MTADNTSQHTKSGVLCEPQPGWFFQNFKRDRPSAATISCYGRCRANCIYCQEAKLGNIDRSASRTARAIAQFCCYRRICKMLHVSVVVVVVVVVVVIMQ